MKSYFYSTQPGDWLSKISLTYFGSAKEEIWRKLYEFNKEVIGPNPDILLPGTLLWFPPSMIRMLKSKENLTIIDGNKQEAEKILAISKNNLAKKSAFKFDTNKILIITGLGLTALALFAPKKKRQMYMET